MAIKDNICTVDLPTTAASWVLKDYFSPFDATCVTQLKQLGAIIVGKTNLDTFGMGSTTSHSFFGPTLQPSNLCAGGSSGGSAVAVQTGMVYAALGSDTGGSLRLPSSYCGLVSYKPSYGMISRYGLLSLAPSLDTLGWFTNDVQDTLYLSEWMLFDSSSTQVHASHDFTYQRRASSSSSSSSSCSSTPFRIGVPTSLNFTHLSSLTREGWSTCLQACSSIPSTTVVDLCSIWPPASLVLSVYHLLTACEAASVLATYMDGIRFGEPASLDPQGFESLVNMRKCIGWHAVTTK
ncbi:Trimeric GatFAB AmidoTransferase(AdT) complex subunit, partial [Coelomomyces lativittatus]